MYSNNYQSATNTLRTLFAMAHEYCEGTLEGCGDKVLRWTPTPGPAPVIGQYAHIVASEDWLINVKARGSAPLMATTYAGRSGFRTPPPPVRWDEWVKSETIDVAALRRYGRAVYAATDEYLANLSDDALERIVDMSDLGMGKIPLTAVLFLALANVCVHTGEISALKGLQGLVGYPELAAEAQPVAA
jgi:hypothetical protein